MVSPFRCNAEVDKIIPQVNKIGNLMSPLVLGTGRGGGSGFRFARAKLLQDFTSDPDKITRQLRRSSREACQPTEDAVDKAMRMLQIAR